MSKKQLIPISVAALIASAAMLMVPRAALTAAAQSASPATPAPPAAPAAARPENDQDLEAQLEAARKQLEQAAHEVARLSTQMSGVTIEGMMPFSESAHHATLGLQLEAAGSTGGARVREVSPGGPAAEAGIQVGDVILAVNGVELKGAEPVRQVVHAMSNVAPESKVNVRLLRNGKERSVTVTARAAGGGGFEVFQELPDMNMKFLAVPPMRGAFLMHGGLMDMELATLTPRLGSYFGAERGVLVVRAPADGALKLEDGDVILAIDGRQPASGSQATRILGSYQPGEKITLRIIRQKKTLDIETTFPQPSDARKGMMREDGSVRDELPPGRPVLIQGHGTA